MDGDGMEGEWGCDVCGASFSIDGVESAVLMHGIIDAWRSAHTHTELELRMWHDRQITIAEYEHSHPWAGKADDDG
jgi:hypothetical protein